jgi:hypothetical protein
MFLRSAFMLGAAVAWHPPTTPLRRRIVAGGSTARAIRLRRTTLRRYACETYFPPGVDPTARYLLPLKGPQPPGSTPLGPCIHHVVVDAHYDPTALIVGYPTSSSSTHTTTTDECGLGRSTAAPEVATAAAAATTPSLQPRPSLRAVLAFETNLPSEYLDALADFGAIYLAPSQAAKVCVCDPLVISSPPVGMRG